MQTHLVRTVVAALITRNSKLLVCQRKRGDSNALKWEFPGGKVEEGESAERFEWAGPTVLPKYDFLPADKELIALLASGSIRVD